MKTFCTPIVATALWMATSVAQGAGTASTATTAAAPSGAADAAPVVQAVWVEKKIRFTYVGYTSHFSCDGLENEVRSILKAIGARPGFKVTARACFNPQRGAEWMPNLDLVVAMPQPATPELIAQLAQGDSKRELAGEGAGKPVPSVEAAAPFPARVRRIDFQDSQLGLVQPGDCELVEQMRDQVFKPLGAKIVVDRMDCVPHQLSNGIINLTIEVLEPVPKA